MELSIFRQAISTNPADAVVNDIILAPGAKHVSNDAIEHAVAMLRSKFQIAEQYPLEVIVVGSAKLGFSISEKPIAGKNPLPRYRKFDPINSDIDLAIVSQKLFFDVWRDLSAYAHGQTPFPWDSPLAKYLLLGWIRPDHFPKMQRPLKCQGWWELFHELSTSQVFGRRKVRAGLYFHKNFLSQYQQRAIIQAQKAEADGDLY